MPEYSRFQYSRGGKEEEETDLFSCCSVLSFELGDVRGRLGGLIYRYGSLNGVSRP